MQNASLIVGSEEFITPIFHCDGDHDLHGFANFLFHGVSPFEIWFDFSVFASIIYHSTLPFNVS